MVSPSVPVVLLYRGTACRFLLPPAGPTVVVVVPLESLEPLLVVLVVVGGAVVVVASEGLVGSGWEEAG